MTEYTVEMVATVRGAVTLEADSDTEALLLATESGMEMSDLEEIEDATALRATPLNGPAK
jgi:hypothetical protein